MAHPMLKTMALSILLAIVLYGNGFATIIANETFWINKPAPNFDILHRYVFEYDRRFEGLANVALIGFTGFAIYRAIRQFTAGQIFMVDRLIRQMIAVFILRAVSIMITVLPPAFDDAEQRCSLPITTTAEIFRRPIELAIEIITIRSHGRVLCCDNFYSGHTAASVLFAHFLFETSTSASKSFQVLIMTSAIGIEMAALLKSRMHYTIDILFGAIMAAFSVYFIDWIDGAEKKKK